MGFESTLTVFKKYKKYRLGEEDISKISNFYYEYNKKNCLFGSEQSEEEFRKDLPYVIDRGIYIDGNDFDRNNLSDIRNRYFIDWNPCDKMYETSFGSMFRTISDEYGMGHGKGYKSNEIIIPTEDVKQMSIAIKYLLNGKYDKEFEEILDNRWIKVFGDQYPNYIDYKYNTTDDDDYDDESENEEWRYTYRNLLMVFDFALNSIPSYETDFENVVVYSISY